MTMMTTTTTPQVITRPSGYRTSSSRYSAVSSSTTTTKHMPRRTVFAVNFWRCRSRQCARHSNDSTSYTHYSLLSIIESDWGFRWGYQQTRLTQQPPHRAEHIHCRRRRWTGLRRTQLGHQLNRCGRTGSDKAQCTEKDRFLCRIARGSNAVPSNSSIGDGNGQRGNGAMDAKEGNF